MEISDELILKYQLCESTPEEEKALLDYLDESEEHRRRIDKANFIFCAGVLNGKRQHRRRTIIKWLSAAAVIAAVCIGIGLWRIGGQKSSVVAEVPTVVVETPSGSRTRVSLPDGSVVWLRSGSRLTYPESFDRTVALDGEGYFDVIHEENHPFYVSACGIRVEVLGTIFNLRAYSSENLVETTLASGSVRLSEASGKELFLLHPGEKVSCDADGSNLDVQAVDSWVLLLDTYGVVTIPDVSLTELCGILNRVYGVTIRAREDDGTPVTFSFSKDSSVDDVVARLSRVSGKKFDIKR